MAVRGKSRSARRLGAVLVVAIPLALLLAAHSAGAAGPTVSANPTTVAQGAATTVSWSGIASPTSTDWVGLFASSGAANTAFVTWRYTTGTAAAAFRSPSPRRRSPPTPRPSPKAQRPR